MVMSLVGPKTVGVGFSRFRKRKEVQWEKDK